MSDIKVCVECKHFSHAGTRATALCIRPTGGISRVWGKKIKYMSPVMQRWGIGFDACGWKGKYFVPRKEQP